MSTARDRLLSIAASFSLGLWRLLWAARTGCFVSSVCAYTVQYIYVPVCVFVSVLIVPRSQFRSSDN